VAVNITDAAYAVAHDYPGGTESLAPRVGLSGAMLRNKVNPNNDTHKLTLQEAVRLTDVTDDERIIEAWLAERGAVMVKLPELTETPDNEEILGRFMSLTVQYGALAKRYSEATADGEVDDSEMADMERIGTLIHRAVEEINVLTRRIYCRAPAQKPTVKAA
jgi:hypothetical protein